MIKLSPYKRNAFRKNININKRIYQDCHISLNTLEVTNFQYIKVKHTLLQQKKKLLESFLKNVISLYGKFIKVYKNIYMTLVNIMIFQEVHA